MQQALDALIDAVDSQNWEMQQNIDQHGEWYRRSVYLKQATAKSQETIEALRARLAQPERKWQGLTDEEILEEYRQSYGDDGNLTDVYFARAIEAKLKEKNT
jgi:uncharacterized protein YukE